MYHGYHESWIDDLINLTRNEYMSHSFHNKLQHKAVTHL